jgi:polyhydroxybutyrate depolymerase
MQTFAGTKPARAPRSRWAALLTLALVAGTACSDDGGDERSAAATTTPPLAETTTTPPPETTTVPVVAARPSAGCGSPTAGPGPLDLAFPFEEGEYRYQLHVPSAAGGGEPLPVVVGFHGFTQPIEGFDQMSRLAEHGDANGYVVLLPAGISDIFAPLPGSNIDAVATMLDDAAQRVCIDLDRIYATGISMGGTFTSLVGCELADRFAAIAPVAGSYFPETCPTARPVPALIFHGSADPRNPYEGSVATAPPALVDHSRPVAESAGRWAARNGCEEPPEEDTSDPTVTWFRWSCPTGAEVELLRLEGGGHQWPGDPEPPATDVLGAPIPSPDATAVMWEFFTAHAMGHPG